MTCKKFPNIRQRCPRLIAGVAPGSSWDVWIVKMIFYAFDNNFFQDQTFCILSALRYGRVDARQISLLYFLGYLVLEYIF